MTSCKSKEGTCAISLAWPYSSLKQPPQSHARLGRSAKYDRAAEAQYLEQNRGSLNADQQAAYDAVEAALYGPAPCLPLPKMLLIVNEAACLGVVQCKGFH